MKTYSYKGEIITASSRKEAIKQIVTSDARPFKYKDTIVYAVDKERAAIAYTCAKITKDLVKKLKPIVKKLEVTFYEDDHYNYNSWNKKTAKDKLAVMTGGTYDYNKKGKNAVAIEIGWEHGKSTYDCIKPEDMERYITNDIVPVANSFMRKHKGFSNKPIIKYLDNCDLYRVIYVMEDKK